MVPLSLNALFYLFYRLSPFILVCFFVLGSIINSEAKGFAYLVGLIFAVVVSYGFCGLMPVDSSSVPSPACSTLIINGISSETTPIGMVIFSYSFFYLVYPIVKHHLELDNVPLLLFFPLLILGDIYWNIMYSCFSTFHLCIALVVAGCCGLGWSAMVESSQLKGLQYFNIGTNRERCSIATKGRYKCTKYVNGVAVPP